MNWTRVGALALRYTYLYRRSVPRIIEMIFWPAMELLVWGFVTVYLVRHGPDVPGTVTFLIGAAIFWDILYRSQQGVSMSFLEEIWSRNVLNLFTAPVRTTEFLAATYLVGLFKVAIIVIVLGGMAAWFYDFHLAQMGLALLPLFLNLIVLGWATGMFTTSLILRWGQGAEALAWAIPFLIQPLSAVFYPVTALPVWLQPVALAIPSTHVFEGMRAVLAGGPFPLTSLLLAAALNVLWLAGAGLFFHLMFAEARKRGLLSKLGTQ